MPSELTALVRQARAGLIGRWLLEGRPVLTTAEVAALLFSCPRSVRNRVCEYNVPRSYVLITEGRQRRRVAVFDRAAVLQLARIIHGRPESEGFIRALAEAWPEQSAPELPVPKLEIKP
jgi:hypothetical protein